MVYSIGTAVLQVVPSFTGLQTEVKTAARSIENAFREAAQKGLKDGLGSGPALGPAAKTGQQVGQTLAAQIRSNLQAALRSLPKVEVDATTAPAQREMEALRARIEALVPRIGVDVSTADAEREIADIEAKLKALGASSVDVDIRADTATASAALARITAEIERIRNSSPTVNVDVEANEGRFVAKLTAAIEAAQEALPEINIDVSSSAAEVEIAALRARLESLRRQEIDVDISAADAVAEIAAIRAAMDALVASGADIRVDVDAAAASAELAAFEALVQAVDANDVDVDVNVGPGLGGATTGIAVLVGGILSLLPALAPIAAAAGGALGAIGAAALTALPGIATLVLALYGVGDAVKALAKADDDAAKSAQTISQAHAAAAAAARGVEQSEASLANTEANVATATARAAEQVVAAKKKVTDAQVGVEKAISDGNRRIADAETQLERTERSVADAAANAADRVADAKKDAARAAEDASTRVQTALDRQARAERSLVEAQNAAKEAQEAVTAARKTADEQLQDLTLRLESGSLRQQQAILDVQDAQEALVKTLADPTATAREKQQAQLRVEQAKQSLKETQLNNDRLAKENAERQATGITGQDVYTDAVQRSNDAQQAANDAAKNSADAAAAAAKARTDGEEAVAEATQKVVDAQAAQAKQAVTGAEQVADAQQRVVDATEAAATARTDAEQRVADAQAAVTSAVAAQAEQQRQAAFSIASAEDAVTTAREGAARAAEAEGKAVADAGKDARDALAGLSPVGQEFARFLYGLRTPLRELRDTAQNAFLPGLTDGLNAVLRQQPRFLALTTTFGTALGDLARRLGEAFSGPTFTRFFDYLDRNAGPILDTLGTIFGNVFGGLIDLFVDFEPYTKVFLDRLSDITGRFADFAATAADNPAFQDFISYLIREAPGVSAFFGSLIDFLTRLGQAFAPLGDLILAGFTAVNNFLTALGPDGLLVVLALVGTAIAAVAIYFEAIPIAIVAVITAITALVGWLVRLYQENDTFRTIVDAVWSGIQAVISFAWNNVIKPVFQALWDFVQNTLIPVLQFLWKNVFEPAFAGISAAVKFAWENIIKPALAALVWYWQNVLQPALTFLWQNVFSPIFGAIGTIISVWWAAVKIIFDALVYAFQNYIAPALTWLWKNVFEPQFAAIGAVVKTVWENVISPALQALAGFFRDTLGPAVQAGLDAFKTAWDSIKAAAAEPINFIIREIYTNGLKKLFDQVSSVVHTGDGPATTLPVISEISVGKARGGFILPGDSSWRDGDDQLVPMRRGEGVAVSEAMRDPYERARLLEVNRRAMRGQSLRDLQGYAGGGLIEFGKHLQSIGYTVTEHPSFGGVHPVHAKGSQHYNKTGPGGGGAIDINSRPGQSALEQAELGRILPSLANQYGLRSIFMTTGHYNHGHADITQSNNLGLGSNTGPKGGGLLDKIGDVAAGALSSATGLLGDLWSKASDVLSPFTDLVASMKAQVGDSQFAQLAAGTASKGIDLVKDWVRSKVAALLGTSGDTSDSSAAAAVNVPGVEKWRGVAAQALSLTGSPATWISSLLRRMNQESGGRADAVNNWDANASRGDPSKGLMQVIGGTFRRWALPGLNTNIFDPLSNIVASIRYADNRYGTAPTGWDRKGGYATGGIAGLPVQPKPLLFDSGGYLPPGVNTVVNALGRPEPLGNLEQFTAPAARAGSDGPLVQFGDVYPREEVDVELLGRKTAFVLAGRGLGG